MNRSIIKGTIAAVVTILIVYAIVSMVSHGGEKYKRCNPCDRVVGVNDRYCDSCGKSNFTRYNDKYR